VEINSVTLGGGRGYEREGGGEGLKYGLKEKGSFILGKFS
jgi:hypothetical protein